jgi:hypothetical protein
MVVDAQTWPATRHKGEEIATSRGISPTVLQ